MSNATSASANRQKERAELSTRRLLDAAGELIVAGGYGAMTLAAVGERAGYSRGLVTARFGSKEKLLEALIDRIVTGWSYRNVFPRMADKPGRDQIGVFLGAVRSQAERDPRALRVLYALMLEAVGRNPYLHERFAEFHRQMRLDLAEIVRSGVKNGSIGRDLDPDREAELIVAELRGVAYQWALDPEQFDPVPALGYLVTACDRRLQPSKRRKAS